MPASRDVKIRYVDPDDDDAYLDVSLPAISLALVENPKVLEDAVDDIADRYELDAFVANPASWGKVNLATEAYATGWVDRAGAKATNEIIPIPKGVIQAEYWNDKDDHAKGSMLKTCSCCRSAVCTLESERDRGEAC